MVASQERQDFSSAQSKVMLVNDIDVENYEKNDNNGDMSVSPILPSNPATDLSDRLTIREDGSCHSKQPDDTGSQVNCLPCTG